MMKQIRSMLLVVAVFLASAVPSAAGDRTAQLLENVLPLYQSAINQALPAVSVPEIGDLAAPEVLKWAYSYNTLISTGAVQGTLYKRNLYLRLVYQGGLYDEYTQTRVAKPYVALFDMTESTNSVTAYAMLPIDGEAHSANVDLPVVGSTSTLRVFMGTSEWGKSIYVRTRLSGIYSNYTELKAKWVQVSWRFCRPVLGRPSLCVIPQQFNSDKIWHIGYVISHNKPFSDISGRPEEFVEVATFEGGTWNQRQKTYSLAAGLQFLLQGGWTWQISDIQPGMVKRYK